MGKIDIMLKIPSLGKSYEILVPPYLQIGALLPMLTQAVAGASDFMYQPSGQEFLCSPVLMDILSDHKTLGDYNIQNGDWLILI